VFDQRLLPVLSYFLGDRISASSRSILFFVLIHSLGERRTPDVLFRLQALSPDLFLRGALASSDPSDSELGVRLVVLNHDLVANLYLASATTQLHTMVADIESMREMDIFTPGDPDSHWYDRLSSRRVPLAYTKSRHVPRPLRVPYIWSAPFGNKRSVTSENCIIVAEHSEG
jgi:hypothetical protein